MPAVVCPKCGNTQDGGVQCRKCFAFLNERAAAPAPIESGPAPHGQPGTFRRIYRVVRWVVLAGLLLAIVLILKKSPPPEVTVDPQATARFESKIQTVQTDIAAGRPTELRLDDTEINAFLSSNLALKKAPVADTSAAPPDAAEPSLEEIQSNVRDVKVSLHDDRVRAYVLFDFHGTDLSLALEGRLRVENGYLRFEPTGGELGSLPLPQSTLENAVERLMDSPENKEKLRVPPAIRDIRIENGQLVVTYN